MAVCVFSAFPSVLSCQCVDADCGFVSKSIQAKTSQCHASDAPSQGRDSSSQECCGKCRIEKAVVLSGELSMLSDNRHKNTSAEIRYFAGFNLKTKRPPFSQGEFPESLSEFFTWRVLNTTFSFRAPPQG